MEIVDVSLRNTEINTYFGRCRCCLNYGYLKNMWQEHIWQGEKEIYVEMLIQCFALSWEHSDESIEHDQICESCILRLRDANSFKKTILESQETLLNNIDEAGIEIEIEDQPGKSELPVKIEKPDYSLKEYQESESQASSITFKNDPDYPDFVNPDDGNDPDDPDYVDPDNTNDLDDPEYVDPDDRNDLDDPDYVDPDDKNDPDDMDYEEVEYLEIEDNKDALANQQKPETKSSAESHAKTPSAAPPKRKWPRKLPKSERYKTYKQYTEEDLRKCLEAVRNEELTPQEASEIYNIPRKTICAKVRIDPNEQKPETNSSAESHAKTPSAAPPKRKWPRKLPKSERYKTYKQYTEEDLRKCLEAVRNEELTPQEASEIYNIPRKTICAKIRIDPNDDQKGNTTTEKSKLEPPKTLPRKKPTVFRTDISKTKVIKKIKRIKLETKDYPLKDDIHKEKDNRTGESIKSEESDVNVPINADQVRIKYKAIVNAKFKKESKEPEKNDINEMNKHKENIKNILECSNATMVKGFWGNGYMCCFCNAQKETPSELKTHNLEVHNNVGDEVIKVKYVSDLVIRLDITNLKCNSCDKHIDNLELLTEHLVKTHNKVIHTDIKNHIIPFKFETNTLQCIKCRKQFKYFKLLSEHMSEHYRNYECPVCERSFINKQSMQTHSYRHKSGVFKCSHCPKVFDTKPKRSVHERVTHALLNKTRKCNFCDERFSTKDLVQSHEAKIHGAQIPVFNCQACNKSYNSQSSLMTHRKRFHLMLRPHKCSYCDMAFFSRIELRSHTVTHTKSRDFKCDMCNKSFGTRCSLNQHVRGHLDDRRFKCDCCERAFVHRTAFKVHMRSKHDGQRKKTEGTTEKRTSSRSKIINREIILKFKDSVRHILENSNATPVRGHWGIGYGCSYCPYQNPSAPKLKVHTLKAHSDVIEVLKIKNYVDLIIKLDITGLRCNICFENFAFLDEFVEHLALNHDKEIYADSMNYIIPFKFETEYLQCILCSKQFEYFKRLSEHMNEHFRNYSCDICGRGFINKRALKTHLIRHQTGVFICSYCSKVFDTRIKMREHERVLHLRASKTRKCGYCDEKFMDPVRKAYHEVSVHGAPTPSFECKACGKKYDSQRALKSHTNQYHLMLKPHTCSDCGKGFYYKNELKRHEVKHTGLREFQCEVCRKWYSSRKSLKVHMMLHQKERRYNCDICGQGFVQKYFWMQHMRKKHEQTVAEVNGI